MKETQVMDLFVKGKGDNKTGNNVTEIIDLSPDKETDHSKRYDDQLNIQEIPTEKLNFNVQLGENINKKDTSKVDLSCNKETAVTTLKTPTKTIKRIKPICLSPMKHKKKT